MSCCKPVGGVEGVALYSADAVKRVLFSQEGCQVELLPEAEACSVMLIDDGSLYEEIVKADKGVVSVIHRLHLVARRCDAAEWLSPAFIEGAAQTGLVAFVELCDGRHLFVGYSEHFADEQPLMLESMSLSSGKELLDTPTVTLKLVSQDTALAAERLF